MVNGKAHRCLMLPFRLMLQTKSEIWLPMISSRRPGEINKIASLRTRSKSKLIDNYDKQPWIKRDQQDSPKRCWSCYWWYPFDKIVAMISHSTIPIPHKTIWTPQLRLPWVMNATQNLICHIHSILVLYVLNFNRMTRYEKRYMANNQLWYHTKHGNKYQNYSISQEICTRFCCALLCCGYAIVHNEFIWSIYPYSSGLLCWHWGNR